MARIWMLVSALVLLSATGYAGEVAPVVLRIYTLDKVVPTTEACFVLEIENTGDSSIQISPAIDLDVKDNLVNIQELSNRVPARPEPGALALTLEVQADLQQRAIAMLPLIEQPTVKPKQSKLVKLLLPLDLKLIGEVKVTVRGAVDGKEVATSNTGLLKITDKPTPKKQ